MTIQTQTRTYGRRYELDRKQFEKVYVWLSELGDLRSSEGYDYVTFGNDEEHARIDSKEKTIELTNKVEVDVGRLLEVIIKNSK